MHQSVIKLRNVFANGTLQSCVVRAVDFVLLLAVQEEQEARLASQWTVGQARENFFGDQVLNGRKEFHPLVILVELHEK